MHGKYCWMFPRSWGFNPSGEKLQEAEKSKRIKERMKKWIVPPLDIKLAAGGAEQRGFVHQLGTQCGFQQGLDAVE